MRRAFVFKGNPLPKVRMTGRSKWNPRSMACLEYQKMVAWEAKSQKVPQFGKAKVGFARLHFYRYGRTCDIDNLIKSFFDGLEYGEVFANDNQIKAIDDLRVYSVKDPAEARTEFIIYQMDDELSE